jgi:N4-gp56 family major capsid protein
MAVTTTNTSAGFADTITALIRAAVIETLRAGLPNLPLGIGGGIVVPAKYVKGTGDPDNPGRALFRFTDFEDLDPNTTPLAEGVTPVGQTLDSAFQEFTARQYGDVVRVSDVFAMMSPQEVIPAAVEKVRRAAAESVDALAQAVWNSAPVGEIVLSDGSTSEVNPDDIATAVAILATRNVRRIGATSTSEFGDAGGAYVGIAHPLVTADLKLTSQWIETAKYAAPMDLLTGEVGMYKGVRFIESANATVVGSTFRTFIAGQQAIAFTPGEMLSYHAVGFEDSDSDPLAQRASVGWKGFVGGALVTEFGGPRYVVIESGSSLAAYLPG